MSAPILQRTWPRLGRETATFVLYGATSAGGSGFGTIFSLDPATGVLTTLFAPQLDFERYIFSAGVPALSDDGATMYGTSSSGDQTHCGTDRVFACGAVVSMPVDGSAPPAASLIMDGNKNLYSTTVSGGAYNQGTVFKLAPDGTLTTVHSFGGTDGADPVSGVIADEVGYLYGVTAQGGAHNFGTVFKLAPDGTHTVLHSFRRKKDGTSPVGDLIMGQRGHALWHSGGRRAPLGRYRV